MTHTISFDSALALLQADGRTSAAERNPAPRALRAAPLRCEHGKPAENGYCACPVPYGC